MPLYEIDAAGELVPFRRLHGGADLYEREIESLAWANPEEVIGENLFLVQRQPTLPEGGRPDIVALDVEARVVVIEVKRDFDRSQLAQCLEYAGWARRTNLDELARMYQYGLERFFADWQEFTDSATTVLVNPSPRLVLIAGAFHGRTAGALDFLIENRLPVKVIPVTVYEDQQGRKFLDIEAEHEPEFAPTEPVEVRDHTKIEGRRVRLTDLLDAGLLEPGDTLVWKRPQLGAIYEAELTANGAIRLSDGRAFSSPSRAAIEAAEIPAYDGWYAWTVVRLGYKTLDDLRKDLADAVR